MRTMLLWALLSGICQLQAQSTYFEDFENGMPANYHLVNLDGLTPEEPGLVTMADSAWTVREVTVQNWMHGKSAFSVSWYQNDAGPSDDWMVLPAVNIGANSVLSWDALAITSSGDYRDRYQVFIGTDTAIASFSGLTPIYDTGDTGAVPLPTSISLNLANNGYQNLTVHIAFRNITEPYNPVEPIGPGNGGNELAIDNIQVTNLVGRTARHWENVPALEIYPQPTRDQMNLGMTLKQPERLRVRVIDLSGRLLKEEDLGQLPIGDHRVPLDMRDLPSGTYLLELIGESGRIAKKFSVQY